MRWDLARNLFKEPQAGAPCTMPERIPGLRAFHCNTKALIEGVRTSSNVRILNRVFINTHRPSAVLAKYRLTHTSQRPVQHWSPLAAVNFTLQVLLLVP